MVLKRLLVTTLGALGLGALAAGPASAQQIPAPDLFDDQVSCSSNVPSGMANAALGTALGMTIMDGEAIDLAQNDQNQDIPGNPGGALMGLNYIIPPGNNNCGAGGPVDHDMDANTDPVAPSVSGAIATDVAKGYTETLTAYLAVRTEDAAVKAANKALDDLLMDDIDDDIQTATILAARETLAAAETKQTAAHTALYAVGAGPINSLGIAEWRAKFAVEDAVTAWNTAVAALGTAETALNPMDYAKYVPVTSTQLLALVDSNGDINLANVREYANAEGDNTSTQDAMTGVITGPGAFDAAGNLLVPMEVFDHDDDPETADALGPTRDSMTYAEVNTRLMAVGDVVEALEKLQTDNKNALLTPVITEAVRRAKVEQAHYQEQFAAMVADNTDTNPLNSDGDDENDGPVISLKSRYAEYTAAETTRDNKGVELTTAFQARETATAAVAAAFTNPQSFYQQLVDRREFTKAAAEAEVTRLAGLTGDDAATEAQTKAAATAVTAAETALTAATDAQAAFQGLVAEDSPVKALVEELLKSDATGDDGGLLVDTIVGAYDAAADAATTADDAMATANETAESVAGLTGTDGAVSMNTTDIATNTTDIETNRTNIAENTTDIAENRTMIGENADNITTNATNIAINSTSIMANTTAIGVERGRIDQNVLDIATNAGDIVTNAGSIAMNSGRIDVNEMAIASNAGGIASNASMIGSNASAIGMNETRIGELSDELDVVRAGVAASMALAGMPAINGRGISIGVGTFDSESAFAVGFQLQGEMASFKIGVTSSGGETGASAGVGFQF